MSSRRKAPDNRDEKPLLPRHRQVVPDRIRAVVAKHGTFGDGRFGRFFLTVEGRACAWSRRPAVDGTTVSVSHSRRCPTWEEMEAVKRMFFKPGETAMQLQVPESDHISHHPYCLHM